MSLSIVLLGAGNLATSLGTELRRKGYAIRQVYSRTRESAQRLARKLNASWTNNPDRVMRESDFYIVALKDDAVSEVLSSIDFGNRLVIHCSGSLPLRVLEDFSENRGVLYPLQTFSKRRRINFSEIPLFIEANTEDNLNRIDSIARKLSEKVMKANSEERKIVHIAAVFSCNFVNHLYALSESLLKKNGLDFEVLIPLIKETTEKIQRISPAEAQTGPAVRYDRLIIDKHLEALSGNEQLAGLYKSISESIFAFHQKEIHGI
jgi:predicted short-subunit dehydrogenase-like oxidoreductase (DUF2520 family)